MIWLNASGGDFLPRLAVSDLGLLPAVVRPQFAPGWADPPGRWRVPRHEAS
jgi:hypothetical protein